MIARIATTKILQLASVFKSIAIVIIDQGTTLLPIEIKAGKTVNSDFFKTLTYWNKLSGESSGLIVYAGEQEEDRSTGIGVVNWFNLMKKEIL